MSAHVHENEGIRSCTVVQWEGIAAMHDACDSIDYNLSLSLYIYIRSAIQTEFKFKLTVMIQRKPTRIELKPQDKDEVRVKPLIFVSLVVYLRIGSYICSLLPRDVKKRRRRRLQSFLEVQNRQILNNELAILDRLVAKTFDRI